MLQPKRSIIVTLPIRRDNGHVETFQGYRVQHHLTMGPTKGGIRYHPDVCIGEVAALAAVVEEELLALWSGLGYYSRARNLRKAAREIVARGGFPQEHAELRTLAGIGAASAITPSAISNSVKRKAVGG